MQISALLPLGYTGVTGGVWCGGVGWDGEAITPSIYSGRCPALWRCLQDTPGPRPHGAAKPRRQGRAHSHLPDFTGPSLRFPWSWCLKSVSKHPWTTPLRVLKCHMGALLLHPQLVSEITLPQLQIPPTATVFRLHSCDNPAIFFYKSKNGRLLSHPWSKPRTSSYKAQLAFLRGERSRGMPSSSSVISSQTNETESLCYSVPGSRDSATFGHSPVDNCAKRRGYHAMLMLSISGP